jgi:hypothetical protein
VLLHYARAEDIRHILALALALNVKCDRHLALLAKARTARKPAAQLCQGVAHFHGLFPRRIMCGLIVEKAGSGSPATQPVMQTPPLAKGCRFRNLNCLETQPNHATSSGGWRDFRNRCLSKAHNIEGPRLFSGPSHLVACSGPTVCQWAFCKVWNGNLPQTCSSFLFCFRSSSLSQQKGAKLLTIGSVWISGHCALSNRK